MDGSEARERAAGVASYNAYISLSAETAGGPVVAVKDNADVKGMVTTAGGKHLPQMPAERDAPVVAAIRAAGCGVVGKTNLHEYAFGATGCNPHYGPVRNPHDPERLAGGSSGGSAAAVALGTCDWAIGSDTGGSIRIPAGLCGVVGVKPTTGMLSNVGVFPLAETFDTLGPIARDVRTAAIALAMMSGRRDIDTRGATTDREMRLAVPRGWAEDLDEETHAVWSDVTAGLQETNLPERKRIQDACQPIFYAEASSHHLEWMRKRPEVYGEDVLASLQLGLEVTGADYLWGLRQRERLRAEVEAALGDFDAVLVPNTAVVAPRIDEVHIQERLLRFTRTFSYTGHPVVTVPAPSRGLPVGIQVVGHYQADDELLATAATLEAMWNNDTA